MSWTRTQAVNSPDVVVVLDWAGAMDAELRRASGSAR
jgi:hypothetical protein